MPLCQRSDTLPILSSEWRGPDSYELPEVNCFFLHQLASWMSFLIIRVTWHIFALLSWLGDAYPGDAGLVAPFLYPTGLQGEADAPCAVVDFDYAMFTDVSSLGGPERL